jgi:mRNA interferase MazF
VTELLRGRVYGAVLGDLPEKYYLVVSNNRRNAALDSVLAVRLTTSPKPNYSSIVTLTRADPLTGRVLCDDIVELWPDEVKRDLCALTPATMVNVATGLAAALGL